MIALVLACALAIKTETLTQLYSWYAMAQQYVPVSVPVTTLAIMGVESGGWPWTISDNTTGQSAYFATYEQAVAAAHRLDALSHNYDAGLMQVNSANFQWLGISADSAFITQINLDAANRILMRGLQDALSQGRHTPYAITFAAVSYYHIHKLAAAGDYRCKVAAYTSALIQYGRAVRFPGTL